MSTVSELLHANLHDVFGNRDAGSRRRVVERIYAADVVFTDPEATLHGRQELEGKAAALLAEAPEEFDLVAEGLSYASETTGAMGWAFGPVGAPVVRGIDIIRVRDGVIVELETFFAAA
ncbi:nuclear transport factor 2 family protein [Microbacterium sp. B2969]|uniref:Nuclear transport factor 2 family protein n=1 Tax=Microbacterium alkaliflavum TaxID=3248839 RepID=A0ABW7Q6H7_9MICO